MEAKKRAAFRRGVNTLIGLAVLTGLEFYAANWNSATIMFVIGIAKAGLIMEYFMHFSNLWSEGEGGH